jgi:flagellar biogenesis protein FliO
MSPVTSYIVETLVTLAGVVLLATLVLYGGRRLGIGRPSGPLELMGRLPLDARRAVYLVRVANQVYVVGASEAGLTRLGEFRASDLADLADVPADAGRPLRPSNFAGVLKRVAWSDPSIPPPRHPDADVPPRAASEQSKSEPPGDAQ